MKITRIRIPKFKAISDLDVVFNKQASPQIFPITGKNGCGKTTLIYIIFALLFSKNNLGRDSLFLRNILSDITVSETEEHLELMSLEIFGEDITPNYVVLYVYISKHLTPSLIPIFPINGGWVTCVIQELNAVEGEKLLTKISNNVFLMGYFPNTLMPLIKQMRNILSFNTVKAGISYGEFKYNALQKYLTHTNPSNSIILIDGIEQGLHPDKQASIVQYLQQSVNQNNQFFLGTHSESICNAMPRNIKEIL